MHELIKLGAEHSVVADLLPEAPVVLDVGCRGFEFDIELLKLRPLARIFAFDPDPAIDDPGVRGIVFSRKAVTERDVEGVIWQGPGEGAFICGNKGDPGYGVGVINPAEAVTVESVTVETVMREHDVERFDLVKLDCEGSEFGILESWPGPIATQLSVEFHDFAQPQRWTEEYFEKLFAGPLRIYQRVLFGVTPLGPGNSMGHWDSVLVLKSRGTDWVAKEMR